jgi:hypothetical protein
MRAALVTVALIACSNVDSHGPRDAPLPDVSPPPQDAPIVVDAPGDAPVPPDGATTNTGFTPPTSVLAAWTETSAGTFTAEALDLACLGFTRPDQATTVAVSLAITVDDFQSGNPLGAAQVSSFAGTNSASLLATGTTDNAGHATLTIPSGQKRLGFLTTHTNARPTYTYDHLLAPSTMNQSKQLQAISNATAATLPALIGVTPMANTAIAVATVHDCAGHTLSNFVATVSTTSTTATHAMYAQTYYFSDSVGLPVNHTQAAQGTRNGLFMVINVPPLATGYLQVWGFRNASELASNMMTQIAELAVPFAANTAVVVSHEPWATD